MTDFGCLKCGYSRPTSAHNGSRVCEAWRFIGMMKAIGFAPIPARRWTRAFKKYGVPIVYGDVTLSRTGNWVSKAFLDGFIASRRLASFRQLPFLEQVETYVKWVSLRGHAEQTTAQW
jgi:hypothetical protein